MAFTGKATYSAGSTLPEDAEDVSDLVGIVSPYETPLLDILGDSAKPARSTVHEWIEDTLNPNQDTVNQTSFGNPLTDTTVIVTNVGRFETGDQIRLEGGTEVMLVTNVNTGTSQLTIARGYGGTTASALANGATIDIIGNASLEGDVAANPFFTERVRKSNYTQIFASTVDVSGSELAVRQIGVNDELDYQKQNRLRESDARSGEQRHQWPRTHRHPTGLEHRAAHHEWHSRFSSPPITSPPASAVSPATPH